MGEISAKLLEEYKEAFACFGRPDVPAGEGKVAVKDLPTILRALGKNPSQDELQNMLTELGLAADQYIEFKTFCMCMKKEYSPVSTEPEILEAFRAFDRSGGGIMTTQDLMSVMRSFGEPLQDDELDELLKLASSCEEQPGSVDYRKLAKLLTK